MKKGKRIIEYIIFALLTVLCIIGLDRILSWKDTSGTYQSVYKQLYETDENLIDAVFTGSSHCYDGVYPSILWEETGISGFDMAVSGQDLNSSYYALKELLKTQSPKVVYSDVFGMTIERHSDGTGNVFRNYLSMKLSSNYFDNINGYYDNKDDRLDYYLRFPIEHTRYKELEKYDFINKDVNIYGRGEYPIWDTWNHYVNYSAFEDKEIVELTEREVKWLEDMTKLSEDEGFELVLMVLPYSATVAEQRKFNAVKAYCEENGIEYIDFNALREEIGLNDETDLIDDGHINALGAKKVTMYLAKDMERFNLTDHRGDDRYHLWDENLNYYYHMGSRYTLNKVGDPAMYASTLTTLNDTVTVISLEHAFADNPEWYYSIVEPFGMSYEEFLQGGKWIYQNKTLTKVADNDFGKEPFVLKLNRYDTLRVSYYGDLEPTNIMLNRLPFLQSEGNVTIFTYDLFLNDILDVKFY